ncbi:MAG: SDR family oxidoreductase [Acidobacteria bacterium]|nr:SDR family oxidoreductase [Acidobacteriota bacterium]MCA1640409.1 SDR family oxidoreductase [Acidobacteriota bacterium]
MDARGKKVIVTGGVRGLGRALVEKLVAMEASVAVFDLNAQGLAELRARHAGVNCFECDVSSYEHVTEVARRYHEQFGAADVLVNNAGILYSAPLVRITMSGVERHDAAMWDKVLAADLSSVFYMTSVVVEKMIATRTKGVVVNVSSVSAAGNAGQSAYSAAKAGVNALTATWAKELSPMGIRVVAVAPGFTETESTKEAISEAVLRETLKRVPLKRLGKPEEIADGILALIENDFFNGKVFELDGGLVI